MKSIVLGIIFLGFTSLSFSQNQMAAVTNLNHGSNSTTKSIHNMEYLNMVNSTDVSKKIQKLQNVVAKYNIKESDAYRKKSNTTYTVSFKEGENQITAVYDNDGVVLNCKETYQAVKLPYTLSAKIAKTHPGWAFDKINCAIKYSKEDGTSIAYDVVIKQGRKTKTIRLVV